MLVCFGSDFSVKTEMCTICTYSICRLVAYIVLRYSFSLKSAFLQNKLLKRINFKNYSFLQKRICYCGWLVGLQIYKQLHSIISQNHFKILDISQTTQEIMKAVYKFNINKTIEEKYVQSIMPEYTEQHIIAHSVFTFILRKIKNKNRWVYMFIFLFI